MASPTAAETRAHLEDAAQEIARLYTEEKKSVSTIAGLYGVKGLTIARHLRRHGFTIRSAAEQQAIQMRRTRPDYLTTTGSVVGSARMSSPVVAGAGR